MEYMTTAEIREKFLKYFEDKHCKRMPSSSLIPDDPSLLLTSAGMVQFKPYFLQQKKLPPKYIGTTTVQKCVRTNDIDIIGKTGRHLSFFEMLGNFSFGQYFKKEMCRWALDFSVNVMGMPLERLYFTVYKDDDETIQIWQDLGVDPSHISKLGEEDNFWRAGPTGPCGPCSELHYDQGPEFGCGKPDCAPGCDCDRYLEFWNCVFTQFDGQEDGSLKPLPKRNIDTGMGLERMAAIMQGVQSNYETDVLKSLIKVGEHLFNVKYGQIEDVDLALRILADHSRAITFMIADGILPGNEGREYVLRRLLRRCVVKAFLHGCKEPFLERYIDEIVHLMGNVYPEIVQNLALIKRIVLSEEQRFGSTLEIGMGYVHNYLEHTEPGEVIPGDKLFMMHDTYGFPIEVSVEICEQEGVVPDLDGFERCMEQQRERARSANTDEVEAAWSTYGGPATKVLREFGATSFVGYDNLEWTSHVIAIVVDGKRVDSIEKGQKGHIYTAVTPFYGEMGGQVGDTGVLTSRNGEADVVNTIHPETGLTTHVVEVTEGKISVNDDIDLQVNAIRRALIRRNHTATHILHWALRNVLGEHVNQAGSFVSDERLRFDFTHFEALSDDELAHVEKLANEKIMQASKVNVYETSLDEARKAGVTALFGEKYGDRVRVVEAGDFSSELCAGCHATNTAEIGMIKITNESSVGSNARRIEAVTSMGAYNYLSERDVQLSAITSVLRCAPNQAAMRAQANIDEIKRLKKGLQTAVSVDTQELMKTALDHTFDAPDGYKMIVAYIERLEGTDIKKWWDTVHDHLGDNCAAVLCGVSKGKVLMLAAGTPKAVDLGFNANDVIKKLAKYIGGGGGGKPGMAQAGGKNIEGIEDALAAAKQMFK